MHSYICPESYQRPLFQIFWKNLLQNSSLGFLCLMDFRSLNKFPVQPLLLNSRENPTTTMITKKTNTKTLQKKQQKTPMTWLSNTVMWIWYSLLIVLLLKIMMFHKRNNIYPNKFCITSTFSRTMTFLSGHFPNPFQIHAFPASFYSTVYTTSLLYVFFLSVLCYETHFTLERLILQTKK